MNANSGSVDVQLPLEKTWVIIPAFNEEVVIEGVVRETLDYFPNLLVVDDCSSDHTGAVAHAAGASVVRHPINLGQGAALQTGFDYVLSEGAEYVITLDADGQHDPKEAASMLRSLIEEQDDVALGSRFKGHVENMPASRRILLKAALLFTRMTTGLNLSDTHNGLRAFRGDALRKLHLTQNRMAHASEILEQIAAAKLRFHEFGNTVRYTEYSMAKGQRASNAVNILTDLFLRRLIG